MDLEIRHLRLIEAIADDGGVTAAGTRLHLTQSALSHQLRAIERRLGTPLFKRLGRKMVLTPAGDRLLASARSLLAQLRHTEEEIKSMGRDGAGVLRIAIECYTCYHWLPSLIEPFRLRHPRVEVRIVAEETKRTIEALLAGRLDLAVVSSPVNDRRLHARPLFEDEFVVIVAPGHRLAGRPFIAAEDLAAEQLYIYSTPEDSTATQMVLVPAGVVPRQVTQVQLTEAIVELVKAGHGVSVLSRWSMTPHIRSGAVRAVQFTRHGLYRRWSAVRLRSRSVPRFVLDFEELLARDPVAALRASQTPGTRPTVASLGVRRMTAAAEGSKG